MNKFMKKKIQVFYKYKLSNTDICRYKVKNMNNNTQNIEININMNM
jgi:hypothetical protein